MSVPEHLAGAVLSIDLDAVAGNYRTLLETLGGVPSAGVVKADGYGLGAARVGPALYAAGCRVLCVAHAGEGVALRAVLPDAEIHILNGLLPGAAETYHWRELARRSPPPPPGTDAEPSWQRSDGRAAGAAAHPGQKS